MIGLALLAALSQQPAGDAAAWLDEVRALPLPAAKRAEVRRLVELAREQQLMFDRAPEVRAEAELRRLFTASDLVAIATLEHPHALPLCLEVFGLLYDPAAADALTGADVERLLPLLADARPTTGWKGSPAAAVLSLDPDRGRPRLVRLLERSPDVVVRVHAAGALVAHGLEVDPAVRRRAEVQLLRGLEHEATARVAHNTLGVAGGDWRTLQPWMARWIVRRLSRPRPPAALRQHGLSLLVGADWPELAAARRALFERALGDPAPWTRSRAVDGLRQLGLEPDGRDLDASVRADETRPARIAP